MCCPFFRRMESYDGGGMLISRPGCDVARVCNPAPRDPLFAALIKAAGEVGIVHSLTICVSQMGSP